MTNTDLARLWSAAPAALDPPADAAEAPVAPAPSARTRRSLRFIDRAIVRLLDERARLAAGTGRDPARDAEQADLVRRAAGAFPASALAEVLQAIDRGSREVAP